MEQANQQAKRIAMVLGATGGIGGEVARRLVARGWHVRALQRNPDALTNRNTAFEWMRGDAMVREDVVGAAQGRTGSAFDFTHGFHCGGTTAR